MKKPSGIHSCLLAASAFATFLATPAVAQSADLSGDWLLTANDGNTYQMQFAPEGNAWRATPKSKIMIGLKLNPAGLRNQWVGDLKYFGDHEVKAQLKGSDTIQLNDLNDDDSWKLTRQ